MCREDLQLQTAGNGHVQHLALCDGVIQAAQLGSAALGYSGVPGRAPVQQRCQQRARGCRQQGHLAPHLV